MTLGVGVGIGIGFFRDIIAFATKKADPDTDMLRARFGISPTTARRNGLSRQGRE
jgi:hypothetical protein